MINKVNELKKLEAFIMNHVAEEGLTDYVKGIKVSQAPSYIEYLPSEKVIQMSHTILTSNAMQEVRKLNIRTPNTLNILSLAKRTEVNNLTLLYLALHEIERARQYAIMDNSNDDMAKLLKGSYSLLNENRDTYASYNDMFFAEHNININTGIKLLKEIKTKYRGSFSEKLVRTANKEMAKNIHEAYNQSLVFSLGMQYADTTIDEYCTKKELFYDDCQYENSDYSPLLFMKELTVYLNLDNNDIYERENNNIQDNLSDLIMGRKLPMDIYEDIRDISLGIYATSNLFDTIEKGYEKIRDKKHVLRKNI